MYNEWKYIITEFQPENKPASNIGVIFPKKIIHLEMQEVLERCESVLFDNSYPVGAGFLTIANEGIKCYGKSESLQVESRKEVDSLALMGIENFQYLIFPYVDSSGYEFEFPIIFPETVDSNELVTAALMMKEVRSGLKAPIRGGQIKFTKKGVFCSGSIPTLNVESKEADAKYILRMGPPDGSSGYFMVNKK